MIIMDNIEKYMETVPDFLIPYINALGIFVISIVIFGILYQIVLSRLQSFSEKTKTDIDNLFIGVLRTIRPPFYVFVSLYIAIRTLEISELFLKILTAILVVWVIYLVISAVQIFIDYILRRRLSAAKGEGEVKSSIQLLNMLARMVLWSIGIILALSNFGVDVTSLIAGLGIGGIAVALALQNVLTDLFSSFAIHFDKPFVVGDFVVVGDKMGVVKRIGIKTTRIQALQGEEIVISNRELTSEKIQNFKKMKERRVVSTIGVTYETSGDLLHEIPDIIKKIIDAEEKVRFDRAHFSSYADSALMFESVYYIDSADYNEYMDAQQKINFSILDAFRERNINFAYPTQTVYVTKTK